MCVCVCVCSRLGGGQRAHCVFGPPPRRAGTGWPCQGSTGCVWGDPACLAGSAFPQPGGLPDPSLAGPSLRPRPSQTPTEVAFPARDPATAGHHHLLRIPTAPVPAGQSRHHSRIQVTLRPLQGTFPTCRPGRTRYQEARGPSPKWAPKRHALFATPVFQKSPHSSEDIFFQALDQGDDPEVSILGLCFL